MRRVTPQVLGALSALLALAGCPTTRTSGPATDAAEAWRRVSARVQADPADGLATLEAARLALFARNDPDRAAALADRAARAPALTADADLLRTYLAWRRRNYAAVLDRAKATI